MAKEIEQYKIDVCFQGESQSISGFPKGEQDERIARKRFVETVDGLNYNGAPNRAYLVKLILVRQKAELLIEQRLVVPNREEAITLKRSGSSVMEEKMTKLYRDSGQFRFVGDCPLNGAFTPGPIIHNVCGRYVSPHAMPGDISLSCQQCGAVRRFATEEEMNAYLSDEWTRLQSVCQTQAR
jgi:hypothetical protein